MIALTDHLAAQLDDDMVTAALRAGLAAHRRYERGAQRAVRDARRVAKTVRAVHGLMSAQQRLISRPGFQHKLDMAAVPSFGLTLHHVTMRSKFVQADGSPLVVNACPSAGDCIRLCVLNNNIAAADLVQAGWRWRTDLLANFPVEFLTLLAYELAAELADRPLILFRPNINSDLEWEVFARPLVDGSVFRDRLMLYGYTKHATILTGDGWVTPHYRVAYSWNENSARHIGAVRAYLARGGSVGVVTDRWYAPKDREQVVQWDHPLHLGVPVVDADDGDEWMFTEGVIGDLAFKPKSAELRDWGLTTEFVVGAYHDSQRAGMAQR